MAPLQPSNDMRMGLRLRPGDIWAEHEIVEHLASGGAAEVFAARTRDGETRALKILAVAGSAAAEVMARFVQEEEALALIIHPNVVRFHDAGAQGDTVWLSLELLRGETLAARLRSGARLPLDDLLTITRQACEGLAEAHQAGVIHRDLGPDKLFLTPGGGLKVIGFGMAKLRSCGVVTTRDAEIGAARYRAPEQLRGAKAHASMDVYALGHILYEALAGEHAFGGAPRSMAAIVSAQLTEAPRPLRERRPDLPSDLTDLVDQALDKDPARRPASMCIFSARLRDVQERLRAPLRRAARNVPVPSRLPALLPTMPLSAQATTPGPTERVALVPAAPPPTIAPASILPPTERAPEIPSFTLPYGGERSTGAPVEVTVDRSRLPSRGAAGALLGLIAAALALSTWLLLGPALAPPAPRAAALGPLAPPSASASSASSISPAPTTSTRAQPAAPRRVGSLRDTPSRLP
ncbi:MAG: protein kinase [Byssovorax sp.]